MPRPPLTYQPGLDGLRAIAVGLVMAEHLVFFFFPSSMRRAFSGGFIGVDVFFVLSGFLITALLLQEADGPSGIRLRIFYLRRALRLFPALAAVVILMSAYDLVLGDSTLRQVVRSAGSIGLYVVNWVKTVSYDVIPGLGHTWSLAVEEQFYLVWPLVVLAGIRYRWSQRSWVTILVVGIATSAGLKAVLWARTHDWEAVYYRTDARADALLVGALLAFLWHRGTSLRPARLLLLPAVAALVVAVFGITPTSSILYYGGMTLVAIAAAVVIACVVDHSDAQLPAVATALATPLLQHLGRISYGLYLWHVPIYSIVLFEMSGPFWLQALVALVGAWLAAEISMVVIERPFLRLKARMNQQGGREVTPQTPRHRLDGSTERA